MPRQNRGGGVDLIPGKIRKRGCTSSASSSSSILQNYRFKRAILVGKRGGSTTPVPTWRLMSSSRSPASALRGALDSPKPSGFRTKHQHQNQSQQQPAPPPVSARKLAATLWEMNEIPSPSPSVRESSDERRMRKKEAIRGRERIARSVHSGSLPPHLSDPSHSPVSERMDRSGTGSRRRQTPSISQRLRLTDHHHGVDALSNASLMEIETRSRAQTPSACTSTVGVKTRLKDVSNALTTSKELLKIINRVWGHEDRPSTSMSLISALHAELERARLQVNQLIQDQRSDQSEISYLIKCFAEEKAAWESKEQEIVEAAIESVAGELEVERKLRRRLESLNKKLGRELAETKASLVKVVKELESEKRAREIVEQVCDELARNVGEDNIAQVEEEVKKTRKEVEEEREMMQLADVLREGKVQMKLSEAKHQVEEKNSAVDKLRNQLEAFLGSKRGKERGGGRNSVSHHHRNDDDIAALLSRTRFSSYNSSDEKDEDGGEVVEDGEECEQVSAESDLHSIELNMDNHNKSYKWNHNSGFGHDLRMAQIEEEETRGRKSTSGRAPRRSTTLQRSISDGVELHNSDRLDWGRLLEIEKHSQGKGYADELMQGYKSVKGLRDQMLSNSGMVSPRVSASPTRQMGPPWPSRDLVNAAQERTAMAQGGLKSRLAETGGVGHNARKSRR